MHYNDVLQRNRPVPPPCLNMDLTNFTRRRLDLARLKRLLRAAARAEKIRGGSWQVSLVGDAAMAALHQRTMGIPTPTDVLTFDLRPPAAPAHVLDLDTVVCVDEARRHAGAARPALENELLLYAVHSLLHVCGYNDLEPADAARMHAREDALLQDIAVGPVYAPRAAGRRARAPRENAR